jgi:hypothetical protein
MLNPLKSQLPLLWVAIADTFQTLHPKSLETFKSRATIHQDFIFKDLPQLGKDLDKGLENSFFVLTPGHFKQLKGSCYPVFLREYFCQIFHKDGYIKDHFDYSLLRELRTLCFLFYKFEQPFTEEQEVAAYEKFCTVDASVKDAFTTEQTIPLKAVIKDLLPDNPMDIRPRHSGGATADRFSNAEKRLRRRYIPSLMDVYGPAYFFNSTAHVKKWSEHNVFEVLEPSSRVTLVPKDSRGPRTICMEPHERMFIQKGLMHKIYDHIENYSPAKGRVNFTDQSINQRLSYEASISQKYATIDLKDASDMVSWELVQQVFPEEWVVALRATRSPSASLPNGTIVSLKKFAPMGSALCFPVEAMVFYAIVKQVTNVVWVYGDDIIVPTNLAVQVMDLLESYGLLVNRDKSLYKGFFRESCGGDYYKGYNITPIRCKSVDIENTYALANSLSDAFGPSKGEAVCKWYESIVQTTLLRLPLSYKNSNLLAFFVDGYTNEYLLCKRRYNKDLQKYELRGLGVTQRQRTFHRENDDLAYDYLFDYFTNSERGEAPIADALFRKLDEEWSYDHLWTNNSRKTIKSYIDSVGVSTSHVYSASDSKVGYTWVEHISAR